jgi:hypothetical protein
MFVDIADTKVPNLINYGFGEASFEYFESCNFSRENTNIDVSVFMFD